MTADEIKAAANMDSVAQFDTFDALGENEQIQDSLSALAREPTTTDHSRYYGYTGVTQHG